MYGSTCFGCLTTRHQERTTALGASGFTVGEWQLERCWPDHNQQHSYHHAPKVKPEAATAVVELLMMGVRTPETC